jgi:hypothetical protein
MKMVVPIGAKSPQRARESLGQLMSVYKEDISLDESSGELFVSGKPGIQFFKNYIIPNKNGEQVDIDTLEPGGHDLSNIDALKYFTGKLITDSRIPFSRFDNATGGGNFTMNIEQVHQEEIKFNNFILRLRSIFQEIILSPLYWQMLSDFPALRGDHNFKSQLGLKFNTRNTFDILREQEIISKQIEFVGKLDALKDAGGKQIIPTQWALNKWLTALSHEDWVSIRKFKASIKDGVDGDTALMNDGESSDTLDTETTDTTDVVSETPTDTAETETPTE